MALDIARAEHTAIYEAIAAGNADLARAATLIHIARNEAWLREHLALPTTCLSRPTRQPKAEPAYGPKTNGAYADPAVSPQALFTISSTTCSIKTRSEMATRSSGP